MACGFWEGIPTVFNHMMLERGSHSGDRNLRKNRASCVTRFPKDNAALTASLNIFVFSAVHFIEEKDNRKMPNIPFQTGFGKAGEMNS